MLMKRTIFCGVLAVLGCANIAACATGDGGGNPGDEQDIAIDKRTEDPAKILPPDFDSRLTALIGPQDVGKSFGLDDQHVPYPDTYWPFRFFDDDSKKLLANNGIDDRWQGQSEPSPLEKYMATVDPSKSSDARAWEKKNHGEDVKDVANWFGHCPGWTAAAMFNAPLTKGVSAKMSGGQMVECNKGEAGCQTFDIGDINALEAEVFLDSEGAFLGARCDTKPTDIQRDKNGRVLQTGCRGLNPGALVVILANRMKNVKNAANFVPRAIAIDAQNEFNTDQIWNQPAYRYQVNDARAITEQDAIKATHKKAGPLPAKYEFNSDAKGFFRVDLGIKWVQENGPNRKMVSGLLSTKVMRFAAVLELDGDPNSPATRIIGGEFLDDPASGANRLVVPPFVWSADGLQPDNQANGHNPFVKGSIVQQIVKLALK
jgi:hypothetical protein